MFSISFSLNIEFYKATIAEKSYLYIRMDTDIIVQYMCTDGRLKKLVRHIENVAQYSFRYMLNYGNTVHQNYEMKVLTSCLQSRL